MINNLSTSLFDFINSHLDTDVKKLALTKNPFPSIEWKWILNQIASKQKAKHKLPTWFNTDIIVYPTTLSIEQTSSEQIANYKSHLFQGESIIDLTGGFGVDAYYFSKRFNSITHCEWNEDLSEIVQFNAKHLGIDNMHFVSGDSIEYLQNINKTFDYIYVDPARRDQNKNKVFLFKDCEPNVVENIDLLFSKSNHIIIKSSPLVDLNQGINELRFVERIYILAYKNEVKELLWILNKNTTNSVSLHSVSIENNSIHTFDSIFEDDDFSTHSKPLNFLYEPFSAVMKTGLFNKIGNHYNLKKLNRHSHLYTSEDLVDNFPGRIFKIDEVLPYQKKEIKTYLSDKKMNVSIRNFPITVEEIRKKHKIKDGGNMYTFFTTDLNNEKIFIMGNKIEKPIS